MRVYRITPLAERFWSKVSRDDIERVPGLGPCWSWTVRRTPSGYGQLVIGSRTDGTRRNVRANRVAYELTHGPISEGLIVRHRCDYAPCVNPDHLLLGTNQANSDDMVARDRPARGERHGRAKLTWGQVREIRHRRARGEIYRVLATAYGVSPSTIRDVTLSRKWREGEA